MSTLNREPEPSEFDRDGDRGSADSRSWQQQSYGGESMDGLARSKQEVRQDDD